MSQPYYYAAVQCRDERAFQEVRTIGVVMLAADGCFADLRLAPLARKLGENTDLTLIRAVLAAWEGDLADVARRGPAEVVRWLDAHRRSPESVIGLAPAAAGVADDMKAALREITAEFTGCKPGGGAKSWPEKVINQVLRSNGLTKVFHEEVLAADCISWKFPYVHDDWLLHAVDLDQSTDNGIFDAAFKETGRFEELRRYHPGLRVLAVAPEPDGPARERALAIYREHTIQVVPAEARKLASAMSHFGMMPVGEAK
jgi:hypothetical protein